MPVSPSTFLSLAVSAAGPSLLLPWHDFFLLVGTASATLLGLVFVAASIAATIPNEKLGTDEMRALWVLPLIYAFLRVLIVCAVGVIPGQTGFTFGLVLAVLGTGDLVRMRWVLKGLRNQHRNVKALEASDWRWYFYYPAGSTLVVASAGVLLVLRIDAGMYALAAGGLFHLIIGIHNAWELADYLATLQ